MAFELIHTKWKLASHNGSKKQMKTMDARDSEQWQDAIEVVKERLKPHDNF